MNNKKTNDPIKLKNLSGIDLQFSKKYIHRKNFKTNHIFYTFKKEKKNCFKNIMPFFKKTKCSYGSCGKVSFFTFSALFSLYYPVFLYV